MNDLEQAVREAALEVARQRTPALAAVDDAQRLSEDLGLTSLDLAQLVALLEIRLGLDPFSTQTSISAVRTVGDLCQTYIRCAGEP
jgi:acyl carrier protein